MSSKEMEFTIDGYHFSKHNNRIIAESRGKKDEKELNLIAKLDMEHYLNTRKGGIIHKGKWQWCLNSDECGKAVYTPICEIEKTKGKIFCSHRCRNKILKREKRPRTTLKIKTPEIKAPIVVVKKRQPASRQPDSIQQVQVQQETKHEKKLFKEIPATVPEKSGSVAKPEPKSSNNEKSNIKKGLKCSACGVILEKINGNPGRCPVCKGDAIFMVVELSSELSA